MKFNQVIKSVALMSCLIACNTAQNVAAEESVPSATPYRPTAASPANLSEPGWLEVEIGFQRIKGGSDKQRDSFPALAKLAFSENWGVMVGGELAVHRTDFDDMKYKGGGDTSITLKHRIPTAVEGTSWGFEAGVKSPTANDTIGSGKSDYTLNGIYSLDFSGNHLDLNLGATHLGAINDGESRIAYSWASALSRSLDEKWGVFGGLNGVYQRGVPSLSQFMAGASYNFSKRVVFDAGASTGMVSNAQDWSVFAGVTILMNRLW